MPIPPPDLRALRARLLRWYRENRRDLPWRRTGDPYAIWISEVMLQQTRVDTVVPYYEAFLERWPSVIDLACADPDDVRAAWSGLGYYRRARLMVEAAQVIASDHEGSFPDDPEVLLDLPGFGRYTAGAVASIAFDRPTPAVDGNVARVLARIGGIEGDVSRGEPQRAVWRFAEQLAPGPSPGEYTQSVIELGALICGPRRPKCLLCPVNDRCSARASGRVDEIPAPRKKPIRRSLEWTCFVWIQSDHVLLEKQSDRGLFAGLWTPPILDQKLTPTEASDLIGERFRWRIEDARASGEIKHVLTHRDLRLTLIRLSGRRPRVREPFRWIRLRDLSDLGLPSLTVKILRSTLASEELGGTTLPGRRTSRRG